MPSCLPVASSVEAGGAARREGAANIITIIIVRLMIFAQSACISLPLSIFVQMF